jgi:hypothetical protein
MRTLRRLRAQAPRQVRRRARFDLSDATTEPIEPTPEAVFDRITGPFGSRYYDEET